MSVHEVRWSTRLPNTDVWKPGEFNFSQNAEHIKHTGLSSYRFYEYHPKYREQSYHLKLTALQGFFCFYYFEPKLHAVMHHLMTGICSEKLVVR